MRDALARTTSSFEDDESSHFIAEFVALGRNLVARSTLLARRNEGPVLAMEKRMNGFRPLGQRPFKPSP
jgi:hypothetical protein